MDIGIRAQWYDLPADGRAEYFDWLHNTYLPTVQKRPGYLWAAAYGIPGGDNNVTFHERMHRAPEGEVGQGSQFILAMGAENPHTFFLPEDEAWPEDTAPATVEMLGRREGVRTCVYSEVDRVSGPEADSRPLGTAPGPAVQWGSFRTEEWEQEFDVSKWYAQYRLPSVAEMPGVVAARRLACIAGWPHHGVIYEFTSLRARLDGFQKHESLGEVPGEWTNRVALSQTFHQPGSPSVAERTWPTE